MTSTDEGFSINHRDFIPEEITDLAAFLLDEMDKKIITIGSSGFPVRLLQSHVYKNLLEHMISLMQERIAQSEPPQKNLRIQDDAKQVPIPKTNTSSSTKLNLGCGPHHHPEGWVNADIRENANPDVLIPCIDFDGYSVPLSPWTDNTFDQILISHVLEHLWPKEVQPFLHEVQRVLKVDGQVLIICPDIDTLVRTFVGLNKHGRLGWSDEEHNWYTNPRQGPHTQKPWTLETVIQGLFSELVLEDDQQRTLDSRLQDHFESALPHSEHKWNTYGKRLLEIVQTVFPNSELLGTHGRTEKIKRESVDMTPADGPCEHQWTDSDGGNVWPTTSWHEYTCSILVKGSR